MIVYFILLLLVAWAVERWSLLHSLDGVIYDQRLSRAMVEIGEEFEIVTTVRNSSRRFIPFIKLSEDVPRVLGVSAKMYTVGFDENRAKINSSIYMMPRQKMTRRVLVSLAQRGRFTFNGATLYGGDFLGLSEKAKYFPRLREAVVLPTRIDSANLDETLGGFLGDISVNRFILEDPVLTLGFREYTGREPMKQISWPVTARTGRMMVKNYDHTLELTVTVILNIHTKLYGYAAHPLMERCYSIARGVCETLEEKRIQYAFLTNAMAINMSGAWEYVGDGLGGAHLSTILEGLGRATYTCHGNAAALVDGAIHRAESGRAHIVISPTAVDVTDREIALLRDRTQANVLLIAAEEVASE